MAERRTPPTTTQGAPLRLRHTLHGKPVGERTVLELLFGDRCFRGFYRWSGDPDDAPQLQAGEFGNPERVTITPDSLLRRSSDDSELGWVDAASPGRPPLGPTRKQQLETLRRQFSGQVFTLKEAEWLLRLSSATYTGIIMSQFIHCGFLSREQPGRFRILDLASEGTGLPVEGQPALKTKPATRKLERDRLLAAGFDHLPPLILDAPDHIQEHFLEYFTEELYTSTTRANYARCVTRFLAWCEECGLALGQVVPAVIPVYLEQLEQRYASSTVKQCEIAIRRAFQHLARP